MWWSFIGIVGYLYDLFVPVVALIFDFSSPLCNKKDEEDEVEEEEGMAVVALVTICLFARSTGFDNEFDNGFDNGFDVWFGIGFRLGLGLGLGKSCSLSEEIPV